jgi:NADPH:quinone reductase-like Zn-dependent oxidoreductase
MPTNRQWTLVDNAPGSAYQRRFQLVPDAPIPALPTPTSVLINIKAISLAARDLQILRGNYPAPHSILPNLVPVGAGAGQIMAVGPEVQGWKVGDRCIPLSMSGHYYTQDLPLSSLQKSLGGARHGCAQEYLIIDYEDLYPAPSHLSWEELAAIAGSASTAWCCLFGHIPTVPGSTVLVLGTGGVSLYSAQFALMSGCNVIITSSSDKKLAEVTEILQPMLNPTSSKDAIRTINYNTNEDWHLKVKEWTGDRGVDCVVEVSGWGTVGKSVLCTRKGGLVAVTGYLSTYGKVPDEIVQQGEPHVLQC